MNGLVNRMRREKRQNQKVDDGTEGDGEVEEGC